MSGYYGPSHPYSPSPASGNNNDEHDYGYESFRAGRSPRQRRGSGESSVGSIGLSAGGHSHIVEPQATAWELPLQGMRLGSRERGGYELAPVDGYGHYQYPQPIPGATDSATGLLDYEPRHRPDSLLPRVLPSHSTSRSRRPRKLTKHTLYTLLAFAILLVNLTLTLVFSARNGLSSGVGTFFSGSCERAKRTGIYAHLAINILGTMLLAASGYSMQCLCAPTREDVDTVHAGGGWLDLGVPSWRNLRRLNRKGWWLWWALVWSSGPLHFLYNSAVLDTLSAYQHTLAVVTEPFLSNAPWSIGSANATAALTRLHDLIPSLEKLDPHACISAYSDQFILNRRDVLVVVSGDDSESPNNALLGYIDWDYRELLGNNSWICGTNATANLELVTFPVEEFDCVPSDALASADSQTWFMAGQAPLYCLSERAPEKCKLQFSLHIMIVVIFCNGVKVVCLWLTGKSVGGGKLLLTLGDAVESFLEREDEGTREMCLVGLREVEKGGWRGMIGSGGRTWVSRREWWFRASWKTWMGCNVLCITSLCLIGGLFSLSLHNLTTAENINTLWSLGFGQVRAGALIPLPHHLLGASGLITTSIIANTPQVVLSAWYLMFSGALTAMLVGQQWNRFGAPEGQALRVSEPRKGTSQLGIYALGMPAAYALSSMSLTSLLHWLASQSIFPARIVAYNHDNAEDPNGSIATCGYSPMAIIFSMALLGLITLCSVGVGLRRYSDRTCLVGSCSVAVSAGCHPLEGKKGDIAGGVVRWGVVGSDAGGVGHCSLTSEMIGRPSEGEWYR
ncbi:MAG: hypothetical protein M1840_007705 [Geoglossum simile]|nr:MAG: hypothetical protein M1840_007705 [Geoglossum simile]